MATIQNAITMQDRMTPVFNSMIRAMTSTLKSMEQVDRAANRGVASKAYNKAAADIQRASNEVTKMQNNIKKADQEASKLSKTFSKLGSAALGFNAITQIVSKTIELVNRSAEYLDSLTMTKARLNNINDGLQTTAELQESIFNAAQRSGGSYQDMAKNVAKLNLLAGEAFSSNNESIAFLESLNKMFVVSGTEAQEASAAMYQLTQAMASGRLQGDEFRSIIENAPMLADAIAKYVGVSRGKLKEMSSEGAITADIIKNAMFSVSDEVNAQFEAMPMTWGRAMNTIRNIADRSMEDVSTKFSDWMNSEQAMTFFNAIVTGVVFVANIVLWAIDLITGGINFLIEVFQALQPALIIAGVLLLAWALFSIPTAAAALWKLVASLWATASGALATAISFMIMNWPILLIAIGIGLLIFILNQLGVTFDMVIGFIIGLLYGLLAVVYNVIAFFFNGFSALATFLMNLFINPLGAIKMLFLDMAQYIVDQILWVAKALENLVNMIPGVNVTFTVGLENIKNMILATKAEVAAETGVKESKQMEYKDIGSSYNKGYSTGSNFVNSIGSSGGGFSSAGGNGFDMSQFGGVAAPNLDGKLKGGKLDSVGKIDDDVTITEEDIKLLKDVASTDFVNKFTTLRPEMKVEFSGGIRETADVNKILEAIEDMTEQALSNVIVEEAYA